MRSQLPRTQAPWTLPARPSLRHLKLEAKHRLAAGEFVALHDAQTAIAREHGLSSWARLKQACTSGSHALAHLLWVAERFSGAGRPGWTAPGEDELRQHFDDRFLAAIAPGTLAEQASQMGLRGELVVISQAPLREVGSLLDATALHAGRTAWAHLWSIAQANGITKQRVTEVLGLTGLESVARRRVGGFSLGMKQRLGIAAALLGDPPVLMFDEPVNGLDPEGIGWIRGFFRELAADGRTVLVSSHLMSEMAQTADHLVIIGRGRLLADVPTQELIESSARRDVLVRSPRAAELAELITQRGGTVARQDDGALAVTSLDAAAIGDLAAAHGIAVHALVSRQASLEDAYLDLTRESTDYRGGTR